MKLETKKTVGLIFTALSAAVVVTGIVLLATQVRTHGVGLLVVYAVYSFAILAGCLFVTWIPRMSNYGWNLAIERGRIRARRRNGEVDTRRLRLVFVPVVMLFLELYGLADFCGEVWPSASWNALATVFAVLALLALAAYTVFAVTSEKKTRENQTK